MLRRRALTEFRGSHFLNNFPICVTHSSRISNLFRLAQVLREFPDELRGDVSLHLHREILSLPIFETAPQGFLKLMARHIKSNFCAPGEYLVHTGDALNYIYLVCNGSMEVLQNNMVVAILGKGDLVGCDIPSSLTSEALIKSSSDVKALTYCDLKSIQINGLLDVLKLYPEFAETFCNEIVHDLTFNLREGYENEGIMHAAHSLTLPSISEDDEENDEDDGSGSGSPPSSPPMGLPSMGRRKPVADDWEAPRPTRMPDIGAPGGPARRPALRFCQTKSFGNARSAPDSGDLREEVELTRASVERLDSQLNHLTQDVAKLGAEVRLSLALLQQLSKSGSGQSCVAAPQPDKAQSCQEMDKAGKACAETEPSSVMSPKRVPTSPLRAGACPQILLVGPAQRRSQTRSVQTERFLLDDLLCKLADAGSPPPNSGYSSSSSNEERVRYLIGMHCQRNTEDSESISDDSVLKNSLTIQSMTSSRDVSPFKGSRNSWNTPFGEPATSPLPSPRPALGPAVASGLAPAQGAAEMSAASTTSQVAIDIEAALPSTSQTSTHRRKLSTEL